MFNRYLAFILRYMFYNIAKEILLYKHNTQQRKIIRKSFLASLFLLIFELKNLVIKFSRNTPQDRRSIIDTQRSLRKRFSRRVHWSDVRAPLVSFSISIPGNKVQRACITFLSQNPLLLV